MYMYMYMIIADPGQWLRSSSFCISAPAGAAAAAGAGLIIIVTMNILLLQLVILIIIMITLILLNNRSIGAAASRLGWEMEAARPPAGGLFPPEEELGKGQTGSAPMVSLQFLVYFFGRGTFCVLPFTYVCLVCLPNKFQGLPFFLDLSKSIPFAAAPSVLTPFVRKQGALAGPLLGRSLARRAPSRLARVAARHGPRTGLLAPPPGAVPEAPLPLAGLLRGGRFGRRLPAPGVPQKQTQTNN